LAISGRQENQITLRLMSAKERYLLGGKHSPRKAIYLAVFDCQGMSFTCRFIAAMENYILGGHNIFLAR